MTDARLIDEYVDVAIAVDPAVTAARLNDTMASVAMTLDVAPIAGRLVDERVEVAIQVQSNYIRDFNGRVLKAYYNGEWRPVFDIFAPVVPSTYAAKVLDRGPLAYYRYNEAVATDGGALVDESGWSRNAVIRSNSASVVAQASGLINGDSNKAFSFTGTPIISVRNCSEIAYGAWMNSIEAFTGLFQPEDASAGGEYVIASRDDEGATPVWDLRTVNTSTDIHVRLTWWDAAGVGHRMGSSTPITVSNKYQVGFSLSDTGELVLYLNGAPEGFYASTSFRAGSTVPIRLGAHGGWQANYKWCGRLDEQAFYGDGLTAAQHRDIAGTAITLPAVGTPATQQFLASGTSVVPAGAISADVLVVAGGGGGGSTNGNNGNGAGGAGGVRYVTGIAVTPGASIPVVVGAGGAGTPSGTVASGSNGGASSFGSGVPVSCTGGGGGNGQLISGSSGGLGLNGGSGGGGGTSNDGGYQAPGGTGVAGEGFAGGYGQGNSGTSSRWGGGGGGAGGAGYGGSSAGANSGRGGIGVDHGATFGRLVGVSGWFGGGGGGGNNQGVFPKGGRGGGGLGGGGNGVKNTGGGGGGAQQGGGGGNGGSGIVLVRYNF